MIILTDPHGHYLTTRALVKKVYEKVPKSERLIIAGDLVDRGPRSYELVKWVMEEGIMCVKGNHEWFMVKSRERFSIGRDWHANGGHETLESYKGTDALDSHRDFLDTLPLYLRFEDQVNDEGRHLLVTHTGVDYPFEKWIELPSNLWSRGIHIDMPGVYNVHGHTPIVKPKIERTWANIDTGCFITWEKGFGRLTALRFPQMELFFQENID